MIAYAQKQGIMIVFHYILSFPDDTIQSIKETIKLSKKLGNPYNPRVLKKLPTLDMELF